MTKFKKLYQFKGFTHIDGYDVEAIQFWKDSDVRSIQSDMRKKGKPSRKSGLVMICRHFHCKNQLLISTLSTELGRT
jgi:hypothetical protein